MVIKNASEIPPGEITPPDVYFNRRNFIRAAVLAGTALATGTIYRKLNSPGTRIADANPIPLRRIFNPAPASAPATQPAYDPQIAKSFITDEPRTSFEDISHYNNFYEFSTDKSEVADAASKFIARPWTVSISGLCQKPGVIDLDDILKVAAPEERVYRMRCVEGWSMVIPWAGFPLSKLLDMVQPLSSAKYVAFTTLLDPKRMPNQNRSVLDWPYVEGLRMDEAMHPLTLLASGIYGRELPAANGAPLRLVVPWKYGFKGIKSIVKIELVEKEPPTTWNLANSAEYGFYSNVNPNVDHPRWSQKTENRIGQFGRRDTLMFNGYAEQVASLYAGMDLRKYF